MQHNSMLLIVALSLFGTLYSSEYIVTINPPAEVEEIELDEVLIAHEHSLTSTQPIEINLGKMMEEEHEAELARKQQEPKIKKTTPQKKSTESMEQACGGCCTTLCCIIGTILCCCCCWKNPSCCDWSNNTCCCGHVFFRTV